MTLAARYRKAVSLLEEAEVAVSQDVPLRRFGRAPKARTFRGLRDPRTDPYAFTVAGKREALDWDGPDSPVDAKGRPTRWAWWHHANGAADLVVWAFDTAGFRVVWNGNEDTAVRIDLQISSSSSA